jgi:hypothetical protein
MTSANREKQIHLVSLSLLFLGIVAAVINSRSEPSGGPASKTAEYLVVVEAPPAVRQGASLTLNLPDLPWSAKVKNVQGTHRCSIVGDKKPERFEAVLETKDGTILTGSGALIEQDGELFASVSQWKKLPQVVAKTSQSRTASSAWLSNLNPGPNEHLTRSLARNLPKRQVSPSLGGHQHR